MKYLDIIGKAIQHRAQQSRVLFRFRRAHQAIEQWRSIPIEPREFEQTCLIDLRQIRFDGEQGRRFFALVHLLTRGGFKVWLVPRLGFMQSARKGYKWRALANLHPYDRATAPDRFDLCLTDRSGQDRRAARTLRMTYHAHRELREYELAMPYSFHPDVLDALDHRSLEELRESPKRWHVFFGGNRQRACYEKVRGYYHMRPLNRYEVLLEALNHYSDRTASPQADDDFRKTLTREVDGFVFVDSDLYRIPSTLWLDSLACGRFFIAAPGMNYPISHNCIEAMAVGSIPVLEYRNLFHPSLRDGENCIAYTGRQGFRDALRRIDGLSNFETERLRRGTTDYYDRFLSATAFTDDLRRSSSKTAVHVFPYLARPAA